MRLSVEYSQEDPSGPHRGHDDGSQLISRCRGHYACSLLSGTETLMQVIQGLQMSYSNPQQHVLIDDMELRLSLSPNQHPEVKEQTKREVGSLIPRRPSTFYSSPSLTYFLS